MDKEKLAAIRAKIIAQRRTRIKGAEDEDGKATSLGGFLESRGDGSSVFRNEKQWRTRTTILQSTGKTFSKSISAILSSVKARLVILIMFGNFTISLNNCFTLEDLKLPRTHIYGNFVTILELWVLK